MPMANTNTEPTTDDSTDTDDQSPTTRTIPRARFEIYVDDADEWRWRFEHRNGNVLADSAEGYASRTAALDGIDAVRALSSTADIEGRAGGGR